MLPPLIAQNAKQQHFHAFRKSLKEKIKFKRTERFHHFNMKLIITSAELTQTVGIAFSPNFLGL